MRLAICLLTVSMVIFFVNLFSGLTLQESIRISLIFYGFSFLSLVILDFIIFWVLVKFTGACPMVRKILIIGTGPRVSDLIKKRRKEMAEECEATIIFMDLPEREEFVKRNFGEVEFASVTELPRILRSEVVDEVFVLLPTKSYYDLISEIVKTCTVQGIPVFVDSSWDVKRISEDSGVKTLWAEPEMDFLRFHTGSALIEDPLHRLTKRIFDVVVAWMLVIFLSPIMFISMLAIKLTSPGPVLFKQKRLGINKRLFTIYKFRTMYEDAEERLKTLEALNITGGAAFKMPEDPRVTPVGKFLRKMSIDELPQLFNVIKGDMSLVGPRPLPLRDYENFYDDRHRRRFSVVPGITGLWQVSGRSLLNFDDWMALDLFYIDNWSLKLDLEILWRTIRVVLKGAGAM